jgi:hypothetical protein
MGHPHGFDAVPLPAGGAAALPADVLHAALGAEEDLLGGLDLGEQSGTHTFLPHPIPFNLPCLPCLPHLPRLPPTLSLSLSPTLSLPPPSSPSKHSPAGGVSKRSGGEQEHSEHLQPYKPHGPRRPHLGPPSTPHRHRPDEPRNTGVEVLIAPALSTSMHDQVGTEAER